VGGQEGAWGGGISDLGTPGWIGRERGNSSLGFISVGDFREAEGDGCGGGGEGGRGYRPNWNRGREGEKVWPFGGREDVRYCWRPAAVWMDGYGDARGRARASSRAAALHRGGATAASGSGGLRVSETAKGLRVVAVGLVLAFLKFLIACGILY
jgi:hypothetical protein